MSGRVLLGVDQGVGGPASGHARAIETVQAGPAAVARVRKR